MTKNKVKRSHFQIEAALWKNINRTQKKWVQKKNDPSIPEKNDMRIWNTAILVNVFMFQNH